MGRFFFKAEKEFKLHLVIVLIGRKNKQPTVRFLQIPNCQSEGMRGTSERGAGGGLVGDGPPEGHSAFLRGKWLIGDRAGTTLSPEHHSLSTKPLCNIIT